MVACGYEALYKYKPTFYNHHVTLSIRYVYVLSHTEEG